MEERNKFLHKNPFKKNGIFSGSKSQEGTSNDEQSTQYSLSQYRSLFKRINQSSEKYSNTENFKNHNLFFFVRRNKKNGTENIKSYQNTFHAKNSEEEEEESVQSKSIISFNSSYCQEELRMKEKQRDVDTDHGKISCLNCVRQFIKKVRSKFS
jgi:hypothetical protein